MKTKILSILSGISTNPVYLLKFTLLLIVSFFCFGFLGLAQNPVAEKKRANIWYFGHATPGNAKNAPGFDFTNGTPIVKNDGNETGDGCSSISDTTGSLQFYGINLYAFNQAHDTLNNGNGLIGDSWRSTSQGALMVPKPGSNNIIYFFTANRAEFARYNEVDMSLNAALGSIVKKNVLLYGNSITTIGGKMAAVHHCDGKKVWIMFHEFGFNKFATFLISSIGIDTNAVISSSGLAPQHSQAQYGDMKYSPDGRKIVIVYAGASPTPPQLFNFDNFTGMVSNPLTLIKEGSERGCSFSPDNSKLYIGTTDKKIVQYDLSSGDSAQIMNSRTVLFNCNLCSWGSLQIGLDGKIYIARSNQDSLSVINYPNFPGLSCNFVYNGISLNGGKGTTGIANFIESYFNEDTTAYPCNITNNNNNQFSKEIFLDIYPNPFQSEFNLVVRGLQFIVHNITMYDLLGHEVKSNWVFSHQEEGKQIYQIKTIINSTNMFIIRVNGAFMGNFFQKTLIVQSKSSKP